MYSIEQRVFPIKTEYETNQSPCKILKKWLTTYKNLQKSSKSTVLTLVKKVEKSGSVFDARRGNVGAPVSSVDSGFWFNQDGASSYHTLDVLGTRVYYGNITECTTEYTEGKWVYYKK